MSKAEFICNMAEIAGCEVCHNEPMSRHTSFKIGGPAEVYITVKNITQLRDILKDCREAGVNTFLIGNGSNILVSDEGLGGVVIRLGGEFKNITLADENTIYCGAGASLASLCKFALNCGLSGLEFAWGIPGSVGGALFMNAGAYGGEMKDVVLSVSHITPDGEAGRIETEALDFGYRTSVYRQNKYIITGAAIRLQKERQDDIRAKMEDFMNRRSTKQPLDYPSAGSVFKRPEGAYAGALIEQCGLKGKMRGGAQVSEKHAGFIINRNKATAADVRELIREVQTTVADQTGYQLECELIILN